MMTRISKERDMLSIVRMALSPLGKILAISATLPLIKVLVIAKWLGLKLCLFGLY